MKKPLPPPNKTSTPLRAICSAMRGYFPRSSTWAAKHAGVASGSFEVEAAGSASRAWVVQAGEREISLEIDGVRRRFSVAVRSDATFIHGSLGSAELVPIPRFETHTRDDAAGSYVAPMPGAVREVRVSVGDRVEEGTVMLVLEAMKMEHPITAHAAGVVAEVRVEVDQMVEPDEVLVVVEADE